MKLVFTVALFAMSSVAMSALGGTPGCNGTYYACDWDMYEAILSDTEKNCAEGDIITIRHCDDEGSLWNRARLRFTGPNSSKY